MPRELAASRDAASRTICGRAAHQPCCRTAPASPDRFRPAALFQRLLKMLSYRHAFHAGNHADVLKHAVVLQLLRYLGQKDKAYWYIDTHAGAGVYSLKEGYATKTGEFQT
ncbi:MAG: 23S rRNA (adenine(2030)-N(6))-methyltransferase RlmJ, partial [Paraburkholderia terricola]